MSLATLLLNPHDRFVWPSAGDTAVLANVAPDGHDYNIFGDPVAEHRKRPFVTINLDAVALALSMQVDRLPRRVQKLHTTFDAAAENDERLIKASEAPAGTVVHEWRRAPVRNLVLLLKSASAEETRRAIVSLQSEVDKRRLRRRIEVPLRMTVDDFIAAVAWCSNHRDRARILEALVTATVPLIAPSREAVQVIPRDIDRVRRGAPGSGSRKRVGDVWRAAAWSIHLAACAPTPPTNGAASPGDRSSSDAHVLRGQLGGPGAIGNEVERTASEPVWAALVANSHYVCVLQHDNRRLAPDLAAQCWVDAVGAVRALYARPKSGSNPAAKLWARLSVALRPILECQLSAETVEKRWPQCVRTVFDKQRDPRPRHAVTNRRHAGGARSKR